MYIILRSKFVEAKPQQYIISIITSAGQQSFKMEKGSNKSIEELL